MMSLLLSAREVSAFKKFPCEMVSFWPLPPLTWGENHHWKKQLSFHVLFVSFNVAAIIPALYNSRIPDKKYALFVLEICVTSFPKKAYFPAFYQSPFFFFCDICLRRGLLLISLLCFCNTKDVSFNFRVIRDQYCI